MKSQKFPIGGLPTMENNSSSSAPNFATEPSTLESMETPKYYMPDSVISEETIEIIAEPKLGKRVETMQKGDEFPEDEPALDPEPMLLDETPVREKMREQSAKIVASQSIRKVKITTKIAPLQVRSDPSNKSKVVAQLPVNAIVPMFQETRKWYQVEYLPGKKGWISKKHSKLAK